MTPRSQGDDDDDDVDDAVGRGLCARCPCFPLPVFSIVSLSASEQPPVGQSFPAAPCTHRTAARDGEMLRIALTQ